MTASDSRSASKFPKSLYFTETISVWGPPVLAMRSLLGHLPKENDGAAVLGAVPQSAP